MKTLIELKNFCEKNNVRFELNTLYSEPYEYLSYEDGKFVWKTHRTILGYEFGMNNIAGKKGKSEWQWVWYDTTCFDDEPKDDTKFMFRERYSQVTGRSHKGWREHISAEEIINRRMA